MKYVIAKCVMKDILIQKKNLNLIFYHVEIQFVKLV